MALAQHRGKLFIISGPSGAGKGTICKALLDRNDIEISVSMTTRSPREGEVHGVSYYFSTREEFEKTIAEGGFLEYA
ncbi:MAG: guanylate kinase, partial [Clostridia bacterium]|nr:guanylate kinase [Clostridia bacterium]